jgi:hypothetical protein
MTLIWDPLQEALQEEAGGGKEKQADVPERRGAAQGAWYSIIMAQSCLTDCFAKTMRQRGLYPHQTVRKIFDMGC